MTFDELVEEVFILTNRRDLIADTNSAVKQATLKAHKTDFYSKDIFETGIQFPTLAFRQSLDYVSFASNFRTFKYMRRAEDENDDIGTFIEIITIEETLDSYSNNRTDIAYVAGRVLEIRASVEFQFGLFGFYVLPIVREGAYNSWVAEQFPFAIIYEAVRVIFRVIGNLEESNAVSQLVLEEYRELTISALTDVGS